MARKANAIGLGNEDETRHSSYELRERAWLWCCINLLGSQSALDHGSWPLLSADRYAGRAFHADARIPSGVSSFGDAPCWHLQCEAAMCLKKLYAESSNTGASHSSLRQIVNDFEEIVNNQYTPILDMQHPEHTFASLVAHESIVTMRMLVVRPLHKVKVPHALPNESLDILDLAMSVLKSSINKTKTFEIHRWAWYSWTKWYALAVALAELCVGQELVVVEAVWDIVEACFERYSELVADGERGLLWAPIERLMSKARKKRGSLFRTTANSRGLDQYPYGHAPTQQSTENALTGIDRSTAALYPLTNHEAQAFPAEAFDFRAGAMDLDLDDSACPNWEMFINESNNNTTAQTSVVNPEEVGLAPARVDAIHHHFIGMNVLSQLSGAQGDHELAQDIKARHVCALRIT